MWKRGAANIVVDDLFLDGKWASHMSQTGVSPNRRERRVEEGGFPASRHWGRVCLARLNGIVVAEELGFPRRKRGDGRARKSAPGRPLNRADDTFGGAVTREALDVARYITDMTAQLEAMAMAARLDLLAYFLGMAKAESEIYVRTNAVAEAEREDDETYEPVVGLHHENNSFE
jgi:hypothetical protein